MDLVLSYLRRSADSNATDRQLLERFRTARDEGAFAAVVRRHGPLVWGVCRRNLANPADAEDAFQATFLVLVRRSGDVSHAGIGPWLHRVAVWCCRNVRRANRRRIERVRFGLTESLAGTQLCHDGEPTADLDAAILALPAKYRTPVVLCHLQGWTRRQAAAHLGCPEGTLSALLSRALAKLRARLADRDPAALLAVAGAVAAPPGVSAAAVRAAVIYTTATGSVSPTVLGTADRVVRWLAPGRMRVAAAAVLAVAGLVGLGTGLTARQAADPADPPVPRATAARPALESGQWMMVEWLSPDVPRRAAVLTVVEKDGKPTVTAVEGDTFRWTATDLIVTDWRVRMKLTRQEGPLEYRFDGLFDRADSGRVLGSLAYAGGTADRVTLDLVSSGRPAKPRRPEPPAEYRKWMDFERQILEARGEADRAAKNEPAQQHGPRKALAAAKEAYDAEVPKLFRKLVAEQANNAFRCEAAEMLLVMTDISRPTAADVDSWVGAVRTFAATHGPQYEAAMVGKAATRLIRRAEFAPQARAFAAEADRVAGANGLPTSFVDQVRQWDEERAAWAAEPNPPAAGATWTATVTGKVTDADGAPVADAEVVVNNTQWVKTMTDDGSFKTKTGPDGRYTITLKCQGQYRLHVTGIWAEKPGFVTSHNRERHKILPGRSATVDFTLRPGEPFGGTLKLRSGDADATQVLTVKGRGVDETVLGKNGEKIELTLPPGAYTVELDRGRKKLIWAGLKTGSTDHAFEEPPFRFTPETAGEAFDELWKTMDRNYSYFALKPDVDWNKLRDRYRPKAIKAKSADDLTAVLKDMLAHLKDGHVWIMTPDGKQIGTHRTAWSYNGNRKAVLSQLTDTTECGRYAVVGRTKPDGFGYFLMTQQSAATPQLVAKAVTAIEKLADAPGFIIDLRNANGGSEPLAQEVARLFCEEQVVYAKSKYRDGPGHDEFTEAYPRHLLPAKSGKPYLKPVVCLLGPGCVSSGEGFAKMLAALPHVTTVGLPTRGSSGNPQAVDVGGTGISVYFSRWVDMLPDGTPIEGRGVPVSVRVDVPTDAYKDADPTLAKGLEVLRAKVAGRR